MQTDVSIRAMKPIRVGLGGESGWGGFLRALRLTFCEPPPPQMRDLEGVCLCNRPKKPTAEADAAPDAAQAPETRASPGSSVLVLCGVCVCAVVFVLPPVLHCSHILFFRQEPDINMATGSVPFKELQNGFATNGREASHEPALKNMMS